MRVPATLSRVEIRLLGPVEAVIDGATVPLRRRQTRLLLAILALEPGRYIPVERLADLLWQRQPAHPRSAIQAMVSHLRAALHSAKPDGARLLSRGGDYALDISADAVDLHRFRMLVRHSRNAATAQDRAELLERALGLWRGPALADAADGAQRARLCLDLEELRLYAKEAWLRARLELGEHDQLTEPLTRLVGEHPLRERPRALLMLALYRCGRRGEALRVYRQAREVSVQELGLEPGGELQDLQRAILADDRSLARPTPHVGDRVVPAQLPADVAPFTGRDTHLKELDSLLGPGRPQSTAVVITAIAGTAGVGKTTLAVHWAHQVREAFPDGQLYLNLRGFDPNRPPMTPEQALRGLLATLGVPPHHMPLGLDEQTALYRSLLTDARILVVLDNAHDAAQVRPLLPGAPGCLAMVTSRNQLTGLIAAEGAHPITLDLLTRAEARDLLAARLGADRVATEPEAADEIIDRCAQLPLALTIAAARAVTRPGFPLAALAGELRDTTHPRLDPFDSGDPATDIRAVFSWSYQRLSPDAARLFRLCGLHPGPDMTTAAAASLAEHPLGQTRSLLAELARAHLLVEHLPGRYTFHDLLRAYATELAHTHNTEDGRREAVHRLLDHYLHTAHRAAHLLRPERSLIALAAHQASVTTEQLTGQEQAAAWFAAELPTLLGCVEQAAEAGFDTHTWQLAWAIAPVLDRGGHWHEWFHIQQIAVEAAQRLGDPEAQADAHRHLGSAHARLNRKEQAQQHYLRALGLYEQLGDQNGQSTLHFNLGWLHNLAGRHAEALHHSQLVLGLCDADGPPVAIARALNAIGYYHALLGDQHQARDHCERALAIYQAEGDHVGEAETLDSLGYAHHRRNDHDEAAACFHRAIHVFERTGDRHNQAMVLDHLGDSHRAAGKLDATRAAWQRALDLFTELDAPEADSVRAKLRSLSPAAL